ncbi:MULTISPECIES: MmcQ/YjbR family DNA-binding protein [unclassified Streptococcus]|uniref:MmcQ/YjbR family DNA-binding protein n=1 Tax=unclassified Streptococcus TaxID=2608887 RepID=UPI001431B95D|nr:MULTISPECIES: MmcQ/YjbR family DNA-binding protein [unclassified Streptococcus]MBF0787380.1 MmcQ/YjbR family DNA-binding protein [Streptococcus sp. 19428wC2_LYSM12]MCQ9211081.1 MmcQ/YjbR family DNA-binding protein [Streptococcus sp. B01]MCQ9214356.1 MmcQ/YjbR family DNA-binding protein [Streptococcus sp. O1]
MLFEEPFFKDKIWQKERLLDYGFKEKDGMLTFCQPFMEGRFEARIQVIGDHQASAQIWDLEMDEEYHTFRIQRAVGSFVGEVRESYAAILQQVVQHCTENQIFQSAQGNRLIGYVKEQFQESPDYPFTKAPEIATLRHAANQKWYALVTQVPWTALGELTQAGCVEVMNVKVEAGQIKELLANPAIYPAYHMSKKTWVSISLDDRLADEMLFDLVNNSRNLVAPKSVQSSLYPRYWIIPANPKRYDIDTELRSKGKILWFQKSNIKVNDVVCIYMTAPIQSIRYLCCVTETYILQGDKEYMQLEVLRELTDAVFPLSQLKTLGVKAVRGPRLATQECCQALENILKE